MIKKIKPVVLLFFLFIFLFQSSFSSFVYAISIYDSDYTETDPKLQKLKESLLKSPNFLQYTEYKMLKYKKGSYSSSSSYDYSDYSLRPRGPSPLSKEFRGTLTQDDHYWFTQGVDLITGSRAINESLQLGSIGVGQLVSTQPAIDISEIEPLEIKSHPWQEMIKGEKPVLPDIFSLVPADYFTVYFKDLSRVEEFENAIKSIGGPAEQVYGLGDIPSIKDLIFKRLQIKDIKELRAFIDEAVLVSYDLEFFPHTDYALILKLKSSKFNNFVSSFVSAPAGRHGKVGNYYVIATDSLMYDRISAMAGNRSSSLAEAADVSYVASVLENNYDIFTYFSEAFIKKLTSPAYRINARRRNTILNALETIQYMVFAYRDITGKWPNSVEQIINEGYIASNSIANVRDYSIDSNGIVKHKIWNTLYDVTPLSRVSVDKVFPAEKNFYDSFRPQYQSFWREFLDPVGIAVIIGDQIRFHTIILPLIEETQYNWIKDLAGLEPIQFDFVNNTDRASSLQFVLKLNLEDILYSAFKEIGSQFDTEYQKCVDEFYDRPYNQRINLKVGDICKAKEMTKEEAIKFIKDKLTNALEWKEPEDILSFIGNEITLAAGDSIRFKGNDFSNLDLYFGLELTDTDLTKKFIDHIFKWYERRTSDYYSQGDLFSPDSMLSGLINTSEPIKNEYNGVEFYIIPTMFTNIYYTFLNNRLYITVSQKAMNQLIDGSKSPTKWNNQMARLFEYLGKEHNAMFIADGSKLQTWLKDLIRDKWLSSSGATEFKQFLMYYTEALALAKTMPGYDGSIKNVTNSYYRYAPSQWFDAEFTTHNDTCYLVAGGTEYDAYNIKTKTDYYSLGGAEDDKGKVDLSEITKKFNVDDAFVRWEAAKSFGTSLKFTEDGLDIMVAFNNPERKEFDPRIPSVLPSPKKSNYIYYIIGVISLILIIFVIILILSRRKRIRNITAVT
jgi:hypothetical protein